MTLSASGKKISDIAPPLVVGVLFLAGWEACCRAFGIPSYLVPRPSLIATTLVADAPSLLHALWITLRVTLIALVLASSSAQPSPFCLCKPDHRAQLLPYAIIMR
jgi:NitT/TauT family transport system permease protein